MPPKQNIPILVVNLKRSKDRRSYMQQQLDAYGVRYQFFLAVDGNALTPQQRACYSEEESLRYMKRPLTNGEIGCALSHLQIYEKMVAEGIAELLILEDDAVIEKDFFPIIFQRAQWAPADWKMLHFTNEYRNLNISPHYSIDSQKRYRLYRYIDFFIGTFCYIVNNETARWLINEGYPIHFVADGLTGRTFNALRCYTITPGLCSWNEARFPSIIDEDPQRANTLSDLKSKKRRIRYIPFFIKRAFYLPASIHCAFPKKCQLILKKIVRNVTILRFLYLQYAVLRDAVWFKCLRPLLAPPESVRLNDEEHEAVRD